MNRLLRSTIAIACIALLMGCRTAEHSMTLMHHAEDIVIDNPDSALMLVRSIDPGTIHGKHDRAYYRLVYSEALYYNRMEGDSDTLTRPMMEYYLLSDEHSERARALYQHAITTMNGGNNVDAMFALVEAEKSLEQIDNPRLAGIVHFTKGEIYGHDCLFHNALEEYILAKEYFTMAQIPYNVAYTQYCIGDVQRHLLDYDKAEEILLSAMTTAIENNYTGLLDVVIYSLCNTYIALGDWQNCENIFNMFEEYDCPKYFSKEYYLISAYIAASKDNRETVEEYLNIADTLPNNYKSNIEYFKHIIYAQLDDTNQAYYWLKENTKKQEEYILDILKVSLINMQVELTRQEQEIIVKENKNIRLLYTIACILIIVIGIIIYMYMRYRNIKQSLDIANYISVINELKQAIDLTTKETVAISNKQLEDFIELNKLCEIFYTYENNPRMSDLIIGSIQKFINSIRRDKTYISKLETIINDKYDNIFVKLRNRCNKLNDKELRYILYLLLGFSVRSIAIILETDTAALSRLKYKIKTKLANSDCNNLLDTIFNKKRDSDTKSSIL